MMEKRCRICTEKKDIYNFQTRIDQKSGLRVFSSICTECEVKECPCCRTENKFLINAVPQPITKLRFFRRNTSNRKTWKNGWVCSTCQYIVTEKDEDNNHRTANIRA